MRALTLRLWLAGLGTLLCVAIGVLWVTVGDLIWLGIVLFVIAAGLVADVGRALHRKRRGAPG